MRLSVKNWTKFQHYKDRNPPWIRLHRELLDNEEFQCLPVASRALAPMLWLLASESLDGTINADAAKLAWRLRQSVDEISKALKPLIDKGFFVDASGVLAECKQLAVPEAEAETETEERQIPAAPVPAPRQRRKSQTTPLPDDFGISDRVRTWAASKGYGSLPEHLDAFTRKARAKAYTYANWDDAFMEAIREDWAKLRGGQRGIAPPPEARNDDAERTQALIAEQRKPLTPEQREAADRARLKALESIRRVA